MVHGCCSSPKPAPHGKTVNVHPVGRIGRYEGTAMFLGRREHTESSLQSAFIRRENLNTCVVPPRCRRTSIRKPRQDTVPRADYAGNKKAEKKPKKPLSGEVSPLTTWGLIRVRPRCSIARPDTGSPLLMPKPLGILLGATWPELRSHRFY